MLTSRDEIKKLEEMKLALLVVFGKASEELAKAATSAAYDFDSVPFYSINDEKLIEEMG